MEQLLFLENQFVPHGTGGEPGASAPRPAMWRVKAEMEAGIGLGSAGLAKKCVSDKR